MKLSAPKERLRVKRDLPYLFSSLKVFSSSSLVQRYSIPVLLFSPSRSDSTPPPSFFPPPSGPIRNPRKKRRRRRDLTRVGKISRHCMQLIRRCTCWQAGEFSRFCIYMNRPEKETSSIRSGLTEGKCLPTVRETFFRIPFHFLC